LQGIPCPYPDKNHQILVEKPSTNPDKNGPKCLFGQIDNPDRMSGKFYSMSPNPDKYWARPQASGRGPHFSICLTLRLSEFIVNVALYELHFCSTFRLSTNVDICLLMCKTWWGSTLRRIVTESFVEFLNNIYLLLTTGSQS
jgi:hypothetical protein